MSNTRRLRIRLTVEVTDAMLRRAIRTEKRNSGVEAVGQYIAKRVPKGVSVTAVEFVSDLRYAPSTGKS